VRLSTRGARLAALGDLPRCPAVTSPSAHRAPPRVHSRVHYTPGELEDEWAGEPGRLLRRRYRKASEIIRNQVNRTP